MTTNLFCIKPMSKKTESRPILSLKEIDTEKIHDPLGNFYSGIKAEETKNAYTKTLREFLNAVEEFDGEFDSRASAFARFASKNPDGAKSLLKNYAKHLRVRTEKPTTHLRYLNPNTLPNKFKSIKKFLKMNEIPMEWNGIESIFPELNNIKQTRGYTTNEIQKILNYCTDTTSEFLILAESSSGVRVGAWENQVWNNIRPIYKAQDGYTHEKPADDSKIVCASMVVYGGSSSMYLGLISIEAWDKLQAVREHWIKKMKKPPKANDPIILTRFHDKRVFSKNGIRNKLSKIIERSGVQKPLVEGQRNHEVPITHGMRKRWNKIMSEQKINNDSYGSLIRKERLFGHKAGVTVLDNSYYFSKIEEAVPQYLEAMPEIMISNEYRQMRKINEVAKENKKLEEQLKQKDAALVAVEELKAKVERMERYEKK